MALELQAERAKRLRRIVLEDRWKRMEVVEVETTQPQASALEERVDFERIAELTEDLVVTGRVRASGSHLRHVEAEKCLELFGDPHDGGGMLGMPAAHV